VGAIEFDFLLPSGAFGSLQGTVTHHAVTGAIQ